MSLITTSLSIFPEITMATSSPTSDFEHLVTCVVCFNNFNGCDPRILGCVHGFCVECLDQVFKTKIYADPSTKRPSYLSNMSR